LIKVNHIEGHLLSAWNKSVRFPALGLVVSGGHTEMIKMQDLGKYKILGSTQDDALGEALDKAARMLGLGYPGGAEIEKQAKKGDENKYQFTLPYRGREAEGKFSYSGLKSALFRLVEKIKNDNQGGLTDKQIDDLAASFQKACFDHLIRVMEKSLMESLDGKIESLLVGGGVIFNEELRRRLKTMSKGLGLRVYFPDKELCGDNAGMIGLAGYFKAKRGEVVPVERLDEVDRVPRWRVDES
jgi:N6-L-threonylcarbamoyladenine synthase